MISTADSADPAPLEASFYKLVTAFCNLQIGQQIYYLSKSFGTIMHSIFKLSGAGPVLP